jgi:TonB-linked SusC/RagA family outer membrane protein
VLTRTTVCLLLVGLVAARRTHAQDAGQIQGTVTTEAGRPLPGATVTVVGVGRSATSGPDGSYAITRVPDGTHRVQARLIGYGQVTQAVTVAAGDSVTLDFQLSLAPMQLEGVVVVGYGTQERRDLTGSVATVNAEQIQEIPTSNPMQAIQARVAGVDVVAGGSYRPGVPMNVTVRGIRSIAGGNQPLYVVDGVPLAGGIEDFNPAIIQSIEVLKDASATAAYGSRGSNGVILITTRRGAAGAPDNSIRVTYDAQYGVQSALNLVDMMDGPQTIAERREAARSAGRPTDNASVFTPDELPQVLCATDAAYRTANPGCSTGTDWQRLVLRHGYQQRHQLGLTSVSGNSRLSLTGSYFDQDGITLGQGYKQYSGTVSFENTYKRLRVGVTATGTRSVADIGADASLWGEALANNPLGLPYDSAGVPHATLCGLCTLKIKPTPDALRVNPLRQAEGFVRQQTRNRLFGSIFAELQLGRGFAYRVNFGPDLGNRMDGQFQGANVVFNQTPIGNAQALRTDVEQFAYTLDQLLMWNRTVGNHRFDATLLYGIQSDRTTTDTASARNLPYDSQLWYNLGTGESPQPSGSALSVWKLASYMGRINYAFASRYLVTLTGRYDGSSRLAAAHKWSFFPSVGLGWQIGEEPFMRRFGFISGLKLRASAGTTGNTAINPYQTWGGLDRTRYNFGNGSGAGYRPGSIPNPDLVWERTAQLDIGVDFGLFGDRISGTFDAYRQRTSALLLSRQLPASTGFTQVLQNVGKTENRGWEASITTVNLPGGGNGPRWTTDLSFTHNRNYIIALASGAGNDVGNRWFIGQPINIGTNPALQPYDALRQVFYDYDYIGIWQLADSAIARRYGQRPGDIRVRDVYGTDSVINADDRVIRGNTYPKLLASIYNRLTWRHFDVSFLLQGRLGYTMNDAFGSASTRLFERFNNLDVAYWTPMKCDGGPDPNVLDGPPGMTGAQQAAIPGCNAYWNPSAGRENPLYNDVNSSSPAYRAAGHWRMRNITVGYTLPASLVGRFRFASLRIYAQAQDPFVFTSYYGYDPEAGNAATPPNYRTLIVGANMGF